MKHLIIIAIYVGLLAGFTNTVRADEGTRQKLIVLAQKVHAEDVRLEAIRQINIRVASEAARLGTTNYTGVRNIILTWGSDYRLGLALAKSESGLRCEAYHYNDNGSIDSSIFQLNSVHKWRGNLASCEDNIKIAYQIYKESGPWPWVVWQKGYAQHYL